MNDFFPVVDIYDIPDLLQPEDPGGPQYREAAKALALCMNTLGRVDLRWMADQSGLSVSELTKDLKCIIMQDPQAYHLHHSDLDSWLLRPQYICGNIKDKLDIAEEMNQVYPGRFNSNIPALRSALPEPIPFEEIGITIGSPWIPAEYYAEFAREILELPSAPEVKHSTTLHQWKVTPPDGAEWSIPNFHTYGTMRMPALKILEHTLNSVIVKVHDEEYRLALKSGTARVLNKEETLIAQEKQEALQSVFRSWVGRDPLRVKRLMEIYHNTFACIVACRYDGSFLTLPGLNPDFTPYPHQKNAVARIILEKDVLLNHAVGSGKTNILIMGIHERKRMGLSEKNLVVVPNNVLEAFERAHQYLYPEDRILVIRPDKEFSPANRSRTLEQIRDGDFVAVYMAFSSFDMIRMSRQSKLDRKEDEIRSLRAKANTSADPWEKRTLETAIRRMCVSFEKMKKELPEDKYLPFEQLGITTLAVDEAHNFKNVSLQTRTEGVVCMHATGSVMCDELLAKTCWLRSNGGSLLFATGTPLTNSISDLFVMQLFLQPEQLELLNLSRFDEWIGSFATRQSGFEIDVDSKNFRIMTRFSSFHNLPELISLFANVCDFCSSQEQEFGLPLCDGYIDTVVPKSQELCDYIDELVYRTELIRQKLVKPHEDNLLQVSIDSKLAALDMRQKDSTAHPDPQYTKVYACTLNIMHRLRSHPGTAQLVFCDQGTPKKGFNIYQALKDHLMDMGIPGDQIAFVHDAKTDAQRRKLFDAVNKAKVRVLIGSTAKLGTGVNVQERLIAIHHLDIPWKPSDILQREGRLIRQGNTNPQVYIYRYITTGTFDAYSWQILENKQRFIGQLMHGTVAARDARDIDDTVLTYAEIKALSVGDPLIKTRVETGNLLERVNLQSRQRDAELRRLQNVVDAAPLRLDELSQIRRRLGQDKQWFEMNRERMSRRDRLAFGEELLDALTGNVNQAEERRFDYIHGFAVLLPAHMDPARPHVILAGNNRYEVDMTEAKDAGCIQRIEHLLMNLDDRLRDTRSQMDLTKDNARQAMAELSKGNPFLEQVTRLREQLLEIDQALNRRAEEITF